jgi:uncharacterized protein YbaR (Trm112 family)/SAM-dependent methyltransferase
MNRHDSIPDWFELLQCPDCKRGRLKPESKEQLVCDACGLAYPIVDGKPVLLSHGNSLFKHTDYRFESLKPQQRKRSGLYKLIPEASVNLSRQRILRALKPRLLQRCGESLVLVVGGGQQREELDKLLEPDEHIRVVYSDIDTSANIDLFCDGHELPFAAASFDAVITTAVLEHVIYPETVAGEITRVVKPAGYLYSELPFMQQVHEGAYDFTRYTLSGHRRLFNGFEEIESGLVAGPGTALVWSIENYFLSFSRGTLTRKLIKTLSRLLFSWLKYTDYYLADKPQAMDSASCTYLFATRAAAVRSDAEIIAAYVGAKQMSHT